MNRDAFLSRVRQAAEIGRRYRVAVDDVPPGAGYVGATGDVCDALAAEVKLIGGEPLVVADWSAGRDALSQLIQHYRPHSALCWDHPLLNRLGLADLLAEHGVTDVRCSQLAELSDEQRRATILSAEIGISSADFAVAETGTLVVCAQRGQERVTSLVPPTHVAFVASDQIIADLFDLFGALSRRGTNALPSNMSLISGPSKTGDIELELTTGVHGPGHWHVVIVREPLSS